MGKFYNKEKIEMLKEQYPPGTRIRLLRMDDSQSPPINTVGTVNGIDDAGQILMSWDNGSSLSLIINEDKFEVLNEL